LTARHLPLGVGAAPIAVTEAFGSIWVANIHANDVRRFEPDTMRELARIAIPSAAWFAVADGALWVTSQTGTGLTRIDPATNTVVAHVGDVQPCSAPVVVDASIWQAACDSGVFIRIDPSRNAVVQTVPSGGHIFLVLAGEQLITTGSGGLARLDPDTGRINTIGNAAAAFPEFLASDGTTVWVKNAAGVARIDPNNGRTLGSIAESEAKVVSFAGDHAWVTVRRKGVLKVDLATTEVRRTIPLPPNSDVAHEAGGVLWVTDFEGSELWRIDLAATP
jgi:streptogramin lyase